MTCLCVLTISASAKADWPFSRGGIDSTGVANTTLPAEPELLWKFNAKETTGTASSYEATPVVFEGIIYIGDAEGAFRAIRLSDGELIWQQAFEDTGFVSPAAIHGESLYVVDFNGVILALNRTDGGEQWRLDSKNEAFAGPIVYEGKLLITTESGTCKALDTETGDLLWEFAIDAPLRCAATVVEGHAMLAGCDSKLHAIDLNTGKEVGSVELGSQTGCTAAMRKSHAYFGTEEGSFLAIDTDIKTKTAQSATEDKIKPSVAWSYRDDRRGQGIRTAAAVTDKQVVYASQGKAIYCLDRTDGNLLWQATTRSRLEASPIVVGNQVVVCTSRGRIQLLELEVGEKSWEYDAGGSFLASPVAVDGKLVVANTDGTLSCFGTPSMGGSNKSASDDNQPR